MAQNEDRIIRVLRPSVVVLCGPAGCGKSSFAASHFRSTQIVSSDACRAMVCDDERDQRYQQQTFDLLVFLIRQRLSINRLCVVDSTALSPRARKPLLDTARRFGVPAELFMFNIPVEKCLEMDGQRQHPLGPRVIGEHFKFFEQARSRVGGEGFDRIWELHEEDLHSVKIEILYRPVSHLPQEPGPRKRPSLRSVGAHS